MFFSNRYFKVQNLAILKMKYNYIISNYAQNMRFKKIPNEIKFFGLELVSFILSKSSRQFCHQEPKRQRGMAHLAIEKKPQQTICGFLVKNGLAKTNILFKVDKTPHPFNARHY